MLIAALAAGIDFKYGLHPVDCFNPRHGIHVIRDGETIDFLICFECYSLEMYVDDKYDKSQFLGNQKPFDSVLKDAKVPLATKNLGCSLHAILAVFRQEFCSEIHRRQGEAWHRACGHAEAVGMLGRSKEG